MIIKGSRTLSIYDLEAIKKIIAYIDQSYAKQITAQDLCSRFNIAKRELTLGMKEVTGFSLHPYITRKRIDMAKYLLAFEPNISIQEVCNEVGFNNISSFGAAFKEICSETPKDYKRRKTATTIRNVIYLETNTYHKKAISP
jgi:YesN/AraC family two-component response regulator